MYNYNNFKEFEQHEPQLAAQLLEDKGSGKWQDEELILFYSFTDLAEYELEEGWYSSSFDIHQDFKGAPNPFDFIDYHELGKRLLKSADTSMYYRFDNGISIMTTYGF